MESLLANVAPYWTRPELTAEQLDQLERDGLIERRLPWSKLYRLTDKGARLKALESLDCVGAGN